MCPVGRLVVVTTSAATVLRVRATGADVCVPTVTVTEKEYVAAGATDVPERSPAALSVRPEDAGSDPEDMAHTAVPAPPPVYVNC